MSGNREFVDTNVLVYAHDVDAGDKQARAISLLTDLWDRRAGAVSIQVLQEFFVTVTHKISVPLQVPAAAQIIEDLALWHVHSPGSSDVLAAVEIHKQAQVSFWDAMILRSAQELDCAVVHSEDLNPGQNYGSVVVQNPFAVP